jgi:hypothetical protein
MKGKIKIKISRIRIGENHVRVATLKPALALISILAVSSISSHNLFQSSRCTSCDSSGGGFEGNARPVVMAFAKSFELGERRMIGAGRGA